MTTPAQIESDDEYYASRSREIDASLAALTLTQFKTRCRVRGRGCHKTVMVSHDVGYGGTLSFSVAGCPTNDDAIRFTRKRICDRAAAARKGGVA